MRIRSSGEEREIFTRSNGEFEIPLNEHQGDTIRIMTASFDSFDNDEQVEYGLNPWSNIDRVPLEAAFLPDIDLHGYGLRLLEPNPEETVSLPYRGKISPYDRDVNSTYYRLYFYDTEGNSLGNSDMTFTSDFYTFDGLLQNGHVLDRYAVWYLAALFEQDGFSLSVTTPGHTVDFSHGGTDTSALGQGGDNTDFPARENYGR